MPVAQGLSAFESKKKFQRGKMRAVGGAERFLTNHQDLAILPRQFRRLSDAARIAGVFLRSNRI